MIRTVVTLLGLVGVLGFVVVSCLIIFVRSTESITTSISPAINPPAPSTPTNYENVDTSNIKADFINLFQWSTKNQLTPPILPVQKKDHDTPTNPDQDTVSPIRRIPQTFGFCVMTSDANQIITSLPNNQFGFGQFLWKNTDLDSSAPLYAINKDEDSKNILDNMLLTQDKKSINFGGFAIGTIGIRSLALSIDDNRLYVAFFDTENSDLSFGQYSGKIQVFQKSSPNAWVRSDVIINPFGSQYTGFYCPAGEVATTGYNSFTRLYNRGDEFGGYIRTTINKSNGRYIVAADSNLTNTLSIGRCIYIFEEQSGGIHNNTDVLCLPKNSKFTNFERNSFATCFDIADDIVLVSMGAYEMDRKIVQFLRVDTWILSDYFIDAPNTKEIFATSITINQHGNIAVVGSPSSDIGGSVYLYTRKNGEVFNSPPLKTINDPTSKGAFGWFVTTNVAFTILTVSTNQNISVAGVTKPCQSSATSCCVVSEGSVQGPCDYSAFVVYSINDGSIDIKISNRIYQSQFPEYSPFIDPLFGGVVAISSSPAPNGNYILIASSPLNQSMTIFEIYKKKDSDS